jgi:adenylate kinase family enzyme
MSEPTKRPSAIDVLPTLAELGERIAVIGPAGAGKSTLAAAMARKTGATLFHLDQLFHQSDTEWVPRPPEEFDRLHAEAMAYPSWVMEGNYSRHLSARLTRATGVIWLAVPRPVCVWRYLRRSFSAGQRRAGGLPGGSERFKWHMMRHILIVQPRDEKKMTRIVAASGKPLVLLRRAGQIRRAYAKWDLPPPDRAF